MKVENSIEERVFEVSVYGFCVIKNVLSEDVLFSIRDKFDRLFSPVENTVINISKDGAGTIDNQKRLLNLPTRDKVFFQLIDHTSVLEVVESILGKEIILASLNGRVVTSDMPEQNLHSDIPYQLWNRDKEIMLNVLWMIDEFREDNGATVILPMSHKSQLPAPPKGKEIKFLQKIAAPAGSVMIFNGNCWHGSTKNMTNEPRRSIFSQYRIAHWLRFQCDPHEGFPEEWLSSLNQRQKELLRMTEGLRRNNSSDMILT